jgi:hypothetical protein
VISEVLKRAEPRPLAGSTREEKNLYAVRFASAMAAAIAKDLEPRMRGIAATPKRTARAVSGAKQLDVNFSTPASGLLLGISLKSVHVREPTGSKRYTHNQKRNEEELRIEAIGYHKRQPYAVMAGVVFLPFDACDDGKGKYPSSFGSWARYLRPHAGRTSPRDDHDRFERIFIGLYELDGSDLRFFDVASDPPKQGRPKIDGDSVDGSSRLRRALTYMKFLDALHQEYLDRNSADFRWADGSEAPLEPNGDSDPLEVTTDTSD